LLDAYRFIGFRPLAHLQGVFGDPKARVVTLVRRSKKRPAACADECTWAGTIAADGECAICPAGRIGSTSSSRFGGCFAGVAQRWSASGFRFWPPVHCIPSVLPTTWGGAGAVPRSRTSLRNCTSGG